jgi:hypothetical protein
MTPVDALHYAMSMRNIAFRILYVCFKHRDRDRGHGARDDGNRDSRRIRTRQDDHRTRAF